MSVNCHKSSIINKKAKLGNNIKIGPYCTVGPNVEMENNVKIHSHVNLDGFTKIGSGTQIFPFSSIGTSPQDLKYKGEKSKLVIGSNNIIREYVTMNPGTRGGGLITRIGNNCLFMISCHVAHDCFIGNNVIMANIKKVQNDCNILYQVTNNLRILETIYEVVVISKVSQIVSHF